MPDCERINLSALGPVAAKSAPFAEMDGVAAGVEQQPGADRGPYTHFGPTS
jgi:hypothetical protein